VYIIFKMIKEDNKKNNNYSDDEYDDGDGGGEKRSYLLVHNPSQISNGNILNCSEY